MLIGLVAGPAFTPSLPPSSTFWPSLHLAYQTVSLCIGPTPRTVRDERLCVHDWQPRPACFVRVTFAFLGVRVVPAGVVEFLDVAHGWFMLSLEGYLAENTLYGHSRRLASSDSSHSQFEILSLGWHLHLIPCTMRLLRSSSTMCIVQKFDATKALQSLSFYSLCSPLVYLFFVRTKYDCRTATV